MASDLPGLIFGVLDPKYKYTTSQVLTLLENKLSRKWAYGTVSRHLRNGFRTNVLSTARATRQGNPFLYWVSGAEDL